jgi:hypothetical protein
MFRTVERVLRRDLPVPASFVFLSIVTIAAGAAECFGVSGKASSGYFRTLPPGSTLPSGGICAERVRSSSWEPRPGNNGFNQTTGRSGVPVDGADYDLVGEIPRRINGDFTGTTDEILQWGACKWGFDEDITRARAVQESHWSQSKQSDFTTDAGICAIIGKSAPCPQSYGILQVKGTVHNKTYPLAERSTAFNVDYALAWLRACYEGAFSHWLGSGYRAGDEWGCIGAWYSGKWYDSGAKKYIASVEKILKEKPWRDPDF